MESVALVRATSTEHDMIVSRSLFQQSDLVTEFRGRTSMLRSDHSSSATKCILGRAMGKSEPCLLHPQRHPHECSKWKLPISVTRCLYWPRQWRRYSRATSPTILSLFDLVYCSENHEGTSNEQKRASELLCTIAEYDGGRGCGW